MRGLHRFLACATVLAVSHGWTAQSRAGDAQCQRQREMLEFIEGQPSAAELLEQIEAAREAVRRACDQPSRSTCDASNRSAGVSPNPFRADSSTLGTNPFRTDSQRSDNETGSRASGRVAASGLGPQKACIGVIRAIRRSPDPNCSDRNVYEFSYRNICGFPIRTAVWIEGDDGAWEDRGRIRVKPNEVVSVIACKTTGKVLYGACGPVDSDQALLDCGYAAKQQPREVTRIRDLVR